MALSTEYYDLIAPEYERLVEADPTNELVRAKIEQYFRSLALNGSVMDFGGGTGLDLPWLLEISEKVIFCEPSSGMRKIATNHLANHVSRKKVTFLDNESSNMLNWGTEGPTSEPLDACLANFGVLNNIRDLRLAFEKLGSVIKPGGDLIVNVLEANFMTMMTRYPKEYLRSLFSKDVVAYTKYHEATQKVYLHSPRKVKKSASPFFEMRSMMPLEGFGFVLVHLKRR